MSAALVAERLSADFFGPRDDTVFAWLGMAGLAINARGTVVLVDPLLTTVDERGEWSETGHRFRIALPIAAAEVPRVDAALFTHREGDHFGELTAATLDRLAPTLIGPPPVVERLVELGLGGGRLRTAVDDAVHAVGAARIRITPCLHDHDYERPWKRGECVGYLVETPDGTIWHPGDTRLIPELLAITGVDVLLFDVAPVIAHLGPRGSARLATTCGAKALIAYHYGTFVSDEGWAASDPDGALPHLAGIAAPFLRPQPGEVLRLGGPAGCSPG